MASHGISGRNYDEYVARRQYVHKNDDDVASKIMEKYWKAKQKFLEKVKKKEDECIVLSDSKLDSKLGTFKAIDSSCERLVEILEAYQNCLFVSANEENALGKFLRDCTKQDKTRAGKIMSVAGRAFIVSSHQRIELYSPILRLYHELETFHGRAVHDTQQTVDKLEQSRTQYRSSLLWMKDISQKLDPDTYRQLEKFRRVQNQVRTNKRSFDSIQIDTFQKIDLLMASRCNLMNQILAQYQSVLMSAFFHAHQAFIQAYEAIKLEDVHDYEFKTLKQLNEPKQDPSTPVHEMKEVSTGSISCQETLANNPSKNDTETDLLGTFDENIYENCPESEVQSNLSKDLNKSQTRDSSSFTCNLTNLEALSNFGDFSSDNQIKEEPKSIENVDEQNNRKLEQNPKLADWIKMLEEIQDPIENPQRPKLINNSDDLLMRDC